MAAPDADPLATAERLRVPLFYGDPEKDYFSVETWTTRVSTNKDSANWNDEVTMANVFNALRGRALSWHMVMAARNIPNFEVWATYKALFIEAFSPAKTSKAVIGIFNGLTQQPKETVIDFFNRVGKASDDITSLRPALPAPVAANWTAEFQALDGFGDLTDAERAAQAQTFMRIGARLDVEHVATQLFIAGLRPSLRDQFLAQAPAAGYDSLWRACQAALEVEKNMRDQTTLMKQLQPMGAVAAVAAEEQADKQGQPEPAPEPNESELAVLRKFGHNGPRGRGRGGRGGGRGGAQRGGGPNRSNTQCHNCGKFGHWKRECRSNPNNGNGNTNGNGRSGTQRVHATSHESGEAAPERRPDNPPAYDMLANPFAGAINLNYQ